MEVRGWDSDVAKEIWKLDELFSDDDDDHSEMANGDDDGDAAYCCRAATRLRLQLYKSFAEPGFCSSSRPCLAWLVWFIFLEAFVVAA